ncbi:MAG: XTP/dITP diphosphatase [Thermoproteota archaeon]
MSEEEDIMEKECKIRLKVYLMTSNKGKIKEISTILKDYGIKVKVKKGKKVEIQSSNLKKIIREALDKMAGKTPTPLIMEDSGLFVKSLRGFPGPYSSYAFNTIGLKGLLKLMEDEEDRRAEFRSVAGIYDPNLGLRVFEGIVKGEISEKPKGERGFGFDPIFIPTTGDGRTFAEMELELKNQLSHRGRSIKKLARWLLTHGDFP